MSAAPKPRKRQGGAVTAATAARAAVQMLAATGKRFTLDGLREKLREFYLPEGHYDLRAVASLTNVQLLSALLDINETLAAAGLQVRVINGLVSLGTTRIDNVLLNDYLLRESPAAGAGAGELTPAMLEVLSCIAFKQPVSQAEIDRIFDDTDRRAVVAALRELGLVETFTGPGGRLQFATTGAFLERFGLNSLEELAAGFSGSRHQA